MGVKITVANPSVSNYKVAGDTLKAVWTDIQKKGPKDGSTKVAAITETEIIVNDRWVPELRGGKCMTSGKMQAMVGVKDMSMDLTSTITLPKLGSGKLSKPAKKEWERFMGKLTAHEKEHIKVAKAVADKIGAEIMQMVGIGEGDDDAKAFEAAKADFLKKYVAAYSSDKLNARIEEAHHKFDKATGHGAKQGASLNTSIT